LAPSAASFLRNIPQSHSSIMMTVIETQRYSTLSSAEALIEVYLSINEPQTPIDEYSWDTKFLDVDFYQVSASLDDVIKTC
jgi:hypothetical protein